VRIASVLYGSMSNDHGSGRRRERTDSTRGVQLAIAAYLLWGSLTIYWKRLKGFDAVELISWRMTCAGVLMAVIVTARRTWPTLRTAMTSSSGLARLGLAAALLASNWGSYVWAVGQERILETALGYFLAPLLTMLIGVFMFGERATNAQRFAFAMAFVAVIVLTISYGRLPSIALVIAASWSLYGLVKRQSPLGPIESLAGETFVSFLPAAVIVIVLSQRADSIVHTATTTEWMFVLGTGVITAIPLMLFAAAAQSVPFTLLGPLNLIVPVINVILGWLIYHEPMPTDRLVGFGFIWIALVAVMWDRVSTARRSTPSTPVTVA
jgi:chloramphenicol-sensitive protein RarD